MKRPAAGAVPVVLICLAAAGCGGSDAPPAAAQTRPMPSVSVAPVQGRDEPVTIEATGDEDKIDSLFSLLRGFGIREIARTGRIAMTRGTLGSLPAEAGLSGTGASRRKTPDLK